MKPRVIVCSYTQNATLFYQLRLCVESILREIPRDHYDKLVVVDDHSPYTGHDFRDFIEHYTNDERIDFMMRGDPRPSYYGPKGRGLEQPFETSEGHGAVLHAAVLQAKEEGVQRVWTLDSDTFVLPGRGDCLKGAEAVMNQHPDIQGVGDYEYGHPNQLGYRCFKEHKISPGGECQEKKHWREGRVHAICGLWSLGIYGKLYERVRTDLPGSPNEGTFMTQFANTGQAQAHFMNGIVEHGYCTGYFPFFWEQRVMHFGFSSLLFSRELSHKHGVGNAPDHRMRYGRRSESSYDAGFLQLNCSTKQLHEHLHALFGRRPVDDVSARFDVKLLRAPE